MFHYNPDTSLFLIFAYLVFLFQDRIQIISGLISHGLLILGLDIRKLQAFVENFGRQLVIQRVDLWLNIFLVLPVDFDFGNRRFTALCQANCRDVVTVRLVLEAILDLLLLPAPIVKPDFATIVTNQLDIPVIVNIDTMNVNQSYFQ